MTILIDGDYKIGSKKIFGITIAKGQSGKFHLSRDVPADGRLSQQLGPIEIVASLNGTKGEVKAVLGGLCPVHPPAPRS
jgi:hypothetical protein